MNETFNCDWERGGSNIYGLRWRWAIYIISIGFIPVNYKSKVKTTFNLCVQLMEIKVLSISNKILQSIQREETGVEAGGRGTTEAYINPTEL